MRALIIREPWIGMVLGRFKTWEIRSRNTKIREWIGLIRGGSGLVVGTAYLADSFPVTKKQLIDNLDKHRMSKREVLDLFKSGSNYRKPYVWVLANPRRFVPPVPYSHPSGAVIWVTIPDIVEY